YLNSAPTLTYTSPLIAPFGSNPFDVTVTGTGFGSSSGDYGSGTQVSILWKGGASQGAFTAMTVSSTTFVGQTTLRATLQISRNVGSFDTNQSTSNPNFQFQVTNPDGQQTAISTNTLILSTPFLAPSSTASIGIQASSDVV